MVVILICIGVVVHTEKQCLVMVRARWHASQAGHADNFDATRTRSIKAELLCKPVQGMCTRASRWFPVVDYFALPLGACVIGSIRRNTLVRAAAIVLLKPIFLRLVLILHASPSTESLVYHLLTPLSPKQRIQLRL